MELVGGEYALLAGTIDPGEGREADLEGFLEGAQGELLIEGKIEALNGADLGAAIGGDDLVGLRKQGAQIDATAGLMAFSVVCCDLRDDGNIDTAERLPCFDGSKDKGACVVPTVNARIRGDNLQEALTLRFGATIVGADIVGKDHGDRIEGAEVLGGKKRCFCFGVGGDRRTKPCCGHPKQH